MISTELAEKVASAARALVGTPYKRNGRNRETGLDCLGVVTVALAVAGRSLLLPPLSTMRRRTLPCLDTIVHQAGLHPIEVTQFEHQSVGGDIVLVRCSAVQWHAIIALGAAQFVHAHAGLRRVVLSSADPTWTCTALWRLSPLHQEL